MIEAIKRLYEKYVRKAALGPEEVYRRLMAAYREADLCPWAMARQDSVFRLGVTLSWVPGAGRDNEKLVLGQIEQTKKIAQAVAEKTGLEIIVDGPFLLAGGAYAMCVGHSES